MCSLKTAIAVLRPPRELRGRRRERRAAARVHGAAENRFFGQRLDDQLGDRNERRIPAGPRRRGDRARALPVVEIIRCAITRNQRPIRPVRFSIKLIKPLIAYLMVIVT